MEIFSERNSHCGSRLQAPEAFSGGYTAPEFSDFERQLVESWEKDRAKVKHLLKRCMRTTLAIEAFIASVEDRKISPIAIPDELRYALSLKRRERNRS